MSTDYYLVCKEKKIYMPAVSMVLHRCSVSDARWFQDFIFACDGKEIKLVHEQSEDMPENDDEAGENDWQFMNAWHPYKEVK